MTQKQTVLNMLTEAGETGVTNTQFFEAYMPRYSARIHELRREGHRIVKVNENDGHFTYVLVVGDGMYHESMPSSPSSAGAAQSLAQSCAVVDLNEPSSSEAGFPYPDTSKEIDVADETGAAGTLDGPAALPLFDMPSELWKDAA